jgi:hypothetical protein
MIPLPPPILAAFGSPLMLWGLAGASLPILIHLLNRRKFRETTWAAMSFLIAAIRKNQKRIRIEQWILLAVRTLLIALLALAMARPALESLSNLGLFAGRRHWVIALDASMSMETRAGERTRFERAQEAARRVVNAARAGDGFSVLALSGSPRVVIGAPSFSKEAVLRAIDSLRATHGVHDPIAALRGIDEALTASDIGRKEVVVISDFQRASWETDSTSGGDPVRALTARLSAKSPRVRFLDVAGEADRNRAVVALDTRPAFVTPGTAVELRARVEAFGVGYPAGRARMVVDGRVIAGEEQQVPPLEPGRHAELSFRHAFNAPGDSIVEVRLDEDALPVDDRRTASITVRDSIRVLLVDGDPRPGLFESETAYLAEAISPEPDSPGQTRPIAVQIASEAQLARLELSAFEVVALCNVARIGREAVSGLEAFLEQGGGLIVFTGDQVQTDHYNRVLFDGGKGLLPAEIGPAVGEAANWAAAQALDPRGLDHPIVADFQGQADAVLASLTNVRISRRHRLIVPPDSATRVALGVAGDPLVVEAPRGRGRVVLVATTADRDWTSWPVHQSYPAVMERIVLEAAAGRLSERNVRVGEPLEAVLPATAAGSEAVVTAPPDTDPGDATPAPVPRIRLAAEGSTVRLRTEPTDRSGAYRVEIGPPVGLQARFAANPDPAESRVERFDSAGLKAALPGLDFTLAADGRAPFDSETAPAAAGELHRPLLWGVLVLVLAESLLAWWFGNRAGLARVGE